MIIGIFGKDTAVRRNAYAYVKSLGKPSHYVYEGGGVEELKAQAESVSLFGEKNIIIAENIFSRYKGNEKEGDELALLCKDSKNIFIFDQMEEEASAKKLLQRESDHFFDASSEKKKKVFPSGLCNALKKRDKKETWLEYLKLADGEMELLHGAVLWQMKSLWEEALAGRRLPYTCEELASINKELVVMVHDAHRGESDFRKEMEAWVLGL
jgi:hypothetical protein